jgi:hypothetical protein
MKKLSNWFIEQTTGTKIIITVLLFAAIITTISLIVNLTSTPSEENISEETPIIVEEEVEEETPLIEPTEPNQEFPLPPDTTILEEGIYPEGETTGDIFPYSEETFYKAYTLAETASLQQCKVIPDETNEQKILRMGAFLPEVETFVNEGYFDNWFNIYERECFPMSTTYVKYDAATDTLVLNTVNTAFEISLEEAEKPANERLIVRERIAYEYILKHNNGEWTIQGIG